MTQRHGLTTQMARPAAPFALPRHPTKLVDQEEGLEGLNDLPRGGQPRKLSAEKFNDILTLTTQRVPHEATHWSVRLMVKYAQVSTWQVRQVWTASDLKPHRLKTFKISNDPLFADEVVDVVGLYLNPLDNALVLSVDEKPQI